MKLQLLIWISSDAAVCWHDIMCRLVGIGLDDVYTAPSPTCRVGNIDSLLTHFTLLSNPPMPMPSMSKSSKSTWTPSSASDCNPKKHHHRRHICLFKGRRVAWSNWKQTRVCEPWEIKWAFNFARKHLEHHLHHLPTVITQHSVS